MRANLSINHNLITPLRFQNPSKTEPTKLSELTKRNNVVDLRFLPSSYCKINFRGKKSFNELDEKVNAFAQIVEPIVINGELDTEGLEKIMREILGANPESPPIEVKPLGECSESFFGNNAAAKLLVLARRKLKNSNEDQVEAVIDKLIMYINLPAKDSSDLEKILFLAQAEHEFAHACQTRDPKKTRQYLDNSYFEKYPNGLQSYDKFVFINSLKHSQAIVDSIDSIPGTVIKKDRQDSFGVEGARANIEHVLNIFKQHCDLNKEYILKSIKLHMENEAEAYKFSGNVWEKYTANRNNALDDTYVFLYSLFVDAASQMLEECAVK